MTSFAAPTRRVACLIFCLGLQPIVTTPKVGPCNRSPLHRLPYSGAGRMTARNETSIGLAAVPRSPSISLPERQAWAVPCTGT